MKALVLGSGGREHALAWRLALSDSIDHVYCTPGNAGMALEFSCIPGDPSSPDEMVALAESLGAGLTVVGPEAPLAAGVVDAFEARGLPIIGPTQKAAALEASKVFAKDFFLRHRIPTARSVTVDSPEDLDQALDEIGVPVALKADGLAAGKGVVLAHTLEEAREAGRALLAGDTVGDAGKTILVEEFLVGREISFIVLTDGTDIFEFRPSQDHKAAYDGDEGPNTGGMGAFVDETLLSDADRMRIVDQVVQPALAGMRHEGHPFRGFLYCGLMMTADGPKTLEFNVRLGDPETQPLLYALDGDFGELLASCAQGKLDGTGVGWKPGISVCVVMASGGYPGPYEKGKAIQGLDRVQLPTKVFHAGTAFRKGRLATSGGRVLGVTAGGSDLDEALARAYEGVGRISFEGARYRRDIGRRPRQ